MARIQINRIDIQCDRCKTVLPKNQEPAGYLFLDSYSPASIDWDRSAISIDKSDVWAELCKGCYSIVKRRLLLALKKGKG